jgi:hypothetical protein
MTYFAQVDSSPS